MQVHLDWCRNNLCPCSKIIDLVVFYDSDYLIFLLLFLDELVHIITDLPEIFFVNGINHHSLELLVTVLVTVILFEFCIVIIVLILSSSW